jgi:hypothetical protein
MKLYFQPDPGAFTFGSKLWSDTHPGQGWEETTPEAFEEWLASRPPLPPPPAPEPPPNFDDMATALRTENGFRDAFRAAFAEDPMATGALTSRFDDFRKDGDFAPFLQAMLLVLDSLPPEQAAEIRAHFPAVAVRCHMPQAFLQALQDAFNAGSAPSPPE